MGSSVAACVRAARLCLDPWPHLELDRFLPAHHAASIAAGWPIAGWTDLKHSDAMLPDGSSRRRFIPLQLCFPDIALELFSVEVWMAIREQLGDPEREVFPQALLVEDSPGYWIRKHTDCAGKVVSAQCYFPDEGAPETQGVVLEPDHQVPYRFNFGYAFKVSRESWHRVRPSAMRRRSLQLIYFDTPTPRI